MPRALFSVYDKTGLAGLAQGLAGLGWELIASGGTAQALRAEGLAVREVAEVTGYPEFLGGRVKTLHPAIHGPILATDSLAHQADLARLGLSPIDLVVCNLYPFAETVARPGVTLDEAVEQIDIGGVTLLRAAAKNHARVTVLCDPGDYALVLGEAVAGSPAGGISAGTRRRLAYRAFAQVARYDAAICDYFAGQGYTSGASAEPAERETFPPRLQLDLRLAQPLRYGENPHQPAALYNLPGVSGPLGGRLLQGKPLSYNNLLDLDAAWAAVRDFAEPTLAVIKHTNPCGLASASTLAEAYPAALAGDPEAAFGGIIAANRAFDVATAAQLGRLFVECIVAPRFEPDALARLASRQNLRLLEIGEDGSGLAAADRLRSVRGGLLAQAPDTAEDDPEGWQVVSERHPGDDEWPALRFAWTVVRHLKSNAIALVQGRALVGAGAGQMSRVDAVHMAVYKAGERARGAALASDAFFPFADGVELAAAAGVRAVIEPGGSVRDDDVIAAANRLGLALVFTGRRHFRH